MTPDRIDCDPQAPTQHPPSDMLQDEMDRADLIAEVEQLRAALLEAASDVEDYARYAGPILEAKWGVAEGVARYRAIAAGQACDDTGDASASVAPDHLSTEGSA